MSMLLVTKYYHRLVSTFLEKKLVILNRLLFLFIKIIVSEPYYWPIRSHFYRLFLLLYKTEETNNQPKNILLTTEMPKINRH